MKRIYAITMVIGIDQLVKYFAIKGLLPSVGGLFRPMICNELISWSIPIYGKSLAIVWLFVALSFVVLLKKTNWNIYLVIAFGGALSNAIDRTRFGCVLDYIGIAKFPIFNIADACIVCGIVIFLISTFNKSTPGKDSAA